MIILSFNRVLMRRLKKSTREELASLTDFPCNINTSLFLQFSYLISSKLGQTCFDLTALDLLKGGPKVSGGLLTFLLIKKGLPSC